MKPASRQRYGIVYSRQHTKSFWKQVWWVWENTFITATIHTLIPGCAQHHHDTSRLWTDLWRAQPLPPEIILPHSRPIPHLGYFVRGHPHWDVSPPRSPRISGTGKHAAMRNPGAGLSGNVTGGNVQRGSRKAPVTEGTCQQINPGTSSQHPKTIFGWRVTTWIQRDPL